MKRAAVALCLIAQGVLSNGAIAQSMTSRDSAVHVLNRLAYGPRPGDVEAVAAGGVLRWIARQLEPELVSDAQLEDIVRTSILATLDHTDLAREYVAAQRRRVELQRQGLDEEGMRRAMAQRGDRESTLRKIATELPRLHVLRAVASKRQLYEIMVDFWVNHFNVFAAKGLDRFLIVSHVEEVIRPRALGSFEDLLIATAKSPAMLFYLDNAQSVTPGARPPELDRAMASARRRGALDRDQRERLERRLPQGLNENYARELLELHTLGVDGGYSQQDVQEVARIFTGWSITRPQQGARYRFNAWAHDPHEKTVLGRTFEASGEAEGIELLRFLAGHPATQRHVSHKLCARLVADRAPDGCVDAAVRAWQRSDGDIREVVRAIVHSPDFWSPLTRGAKTKTPLEFVVSAVRAVGAAPDTTPRLALTVGRLGQPLFLEAAPTGYPETQEDWVNAGALLNRMNFAMALAADRLRGVTGHRDARLQLDGAPELLDRIDTLVFGGSLSQRTRAVILAEVASVSDPQQARALVIGLALGGPDFQRQ